MPPGSCFCAKGSALEATGDADLVGGKEGITGKFLPFPSKSRESSEPDAGNNAKVGICLLVCGGGYCVVQAAVAVCQYWAQTAIDA